MWIMRPGTQHRGNTRTPRGEIDHLVRMVDNVWIDCWGIVGNGQGGYGVWISGGRTHNLSTMGDGDKVGTERGPGKRAIGLGVSGAALRRLDGKARFAGFARRAAMDGRPGVGLAAVCEAVGGCAPCAHGWASAVGRGGADRTFARRGERAGERGPP